MRSQEQAFRAYYSSMTDQQILETAANRGSFIDIAQTTLAAELRKRNLIPLRPPDPPVRHSMVWNWAHHLANLVRHHPAST